MFLEAGMLDLAHQPFVPSVTDLSCSLWPRQKQTSISDVSIDWKVRSRILRWEGAMVEPLGRISYVSKVMPNHVPYLDLIWSRGIFTMSMLIPMPHP
jgi:hypothetical protein